MRPIVFIRIKIIISIKFLLEKIERINWINKFTLNITKRNKCNNYKYKPQINRLKHSAIKNSNFISSSSFQATSCVITFSVFQSKQDYFQGLKENIIMGIYFPIGT